MLNNGKMKTIYDNWKLIFCHDKLHHNNIISNKFTITAVIKNRTTSKKKYFISDVNYKCILQYSRPPLGTRTKIILLDK